MKARASSSSPDLARRQGFARSMREQPTNSERLLWAELSAGKLGVWFRRQVVVGASIVDFLAPARKLVVEVDGGYHGDAGRRRSDARRDRRLEHAGYRGWRRASAFGFLVAAAGQYARAAGCVGRLIGVCSTAARSGACSRWSEGLRMATRQLLAVITALTQVARFLHHHGEPTEPPVRAPARDPPYFKSHVVRRRQASTMAATDFYQTFTLRGLSAAAHSVQLKVLSGKLVVDAVGVVR